MADTGADAAPAQQTMDNADVVLPAEWTLETLQKEVKITLYGFIISPPCNKMRFLLDFYKIPYQWVDGKKPNSAYKKVPVLDIGETIQVNDSEMMVKKLAPVLQGRPFTDAENEIESQLQGLMVEAEAITAGSCCEIWKCAGLAGGGTGCAMRCISCCACCIAPGKLRKGKDLKTLEEYNKLLVEHLGANDWLSGTDRPGVIDASVYGLLLPWDHLKSKNMKVLGVAGSPLQVWHNRMREASADVNLFG